MKVVAYTIKNAVYAKFKFTFRQFSTNYNSVYVHFRGVFCIVIQYLVFFHKRVSGLKTRYVSDLDLNFNPPHVFSKTRTVRTQLSD